MGRESASPKWLAAALVGAFAALAIAEVSSALIGPRRIAKDDDWAAAARAVRAGLRPGDLIAFAPDWVDQVGRRHLGDAIPVEMAARSDSDRYARVWEVSIRGARSPDAESARLVEETHHGRVRVALYERIAPVEIAYDFSAESAAARVTQQPSDRRGDEIPCLRDGAGFRCGSTRIEPRVLEIDYRPRRGLLTPVDAGRTTRIEYIDVALGGSIVGYTGLHDYYSRKSAEGPVEFALFIDDRRVLAVRHANEDGWRRFTVDTSDWSAGRHTVRFEVSAPSPAWRTFGFHAEARR